MIHIKYFICDMYDRYDMYHTYQNDKQSDHYCRKVGNDSNTTGGRQMVTSLYYMVINMLKNMSIFMVKYILKNITIILAIRDR